MCMGIGACYAVDWLIAPVIETNVKVLQKSTTQKDLSVDYFHISSSSLQQKVSCTSTDFTIFEMNSPISINRD
jgi:hypothetical protein